MRTVKAYVAPNGRRVEVPNQGGSEFVDAARTVPGHSFVKRGRDGQPALRFPLDTETARRLRQAFGRKLDIQPDLREWGVEAFEQERRMREMTTAETADLIALPGILPDMYKRTEARPYQRADIKAMAAANMLNANQTGMGKTLEAIGAVFESGLERGAHLVVAPVTSLVETWQEELETHQPYPVLTGESVREREEALAEACALAKRGRPFWLVINPAMVRYERNAADLILWDNKTDEPASEPESYTSLRSAQREADKRNEASRKRRRRWRVIPKVKIKGGKEAVPTKPRYPELFEVNWQTVTVDEGHKTGIANPKTLTFEGFDALTSYRRWVMTATPMGGKPMKLWGYLHWLEPELYTAKWTWADRWLTIEDNGYGKIVGKVIDGMEDEFTHSLQPHMLRRKRRDYRDDLPEEQMLEVWCNMSEKQRKQYRSFEAQAEIRIEEERLSATGVLAEYARLKQFANAACRVEKKIKYNEATNEHEERLIVYPTEDSGKLNYLLERLDENGVRSEDPEPGAKAIVGSESSRMVTMVHGYLRKQGINAVMLHGGMTPHDRNKAIRRFTKGAAQVIVISTLAGGVSLNMEMANSVHILDETWNPDDQEQLWGRADRGTRSDSLLVYWYRTKDTIQEYIFEVAEGKAITNANILDIRRDILALRA